MGSSSQTHRRFCKRLYVAAEPLLDISFMPDVLLHSDTQSEPGWMDGWRKIEALVVIFTIFQLLKPGLSAASGSCQATLPSTSRRRLPPQAASCRENWPRGMMDAVLTVTAGFLSRSSPECVSTHQAVDVLLGELSLN